ncbi:MAG: type II toxin-antitoxin system HipA family toxin, partial [Bacteroidia bacterium]|nr:type II toxin-antitoxin system HipA family toxin [Bacteroidia bacterium]
MKSVESLIVRHNGQPVGTISLTGDGKLCAFEYDKEWLSEGFSISPFELKLKSGLYIAKPQPFYGNFGVFEDSLPDGYGRYLLHKSLLKLGIDDRTLTSLDRLSIVGNSGMGALTYEPETNIDKGELITDFDLLQQMALEVLSEKSIDDAELLLFNSNNSGGCRPKAIFEDEEGHWLIKFRHYYDPLDMGQTEYLYNEVAKKCGINVPDIKLVNGKYFASKRFDITDSGERIHSITAGAILGISLSNPVLDYSNLLALTGFLTQSESDVEEMYRRMIFNYLTDNKDDHCKNFTFQVLKNDDKWVWRLAPAYDLTLCSDGYNGEHATSINGKGHPTLDDVIAVGKKIR